MSNLDSLVNQFYGLDATPAGKQNAEAAIPADAQSNQNVRTFLDLLGAAEGADYGAIVGGGRFDDFSRHPGVVGLRTAEGPSTAAGKYQITKTTYSDFAPKVGVSDFSPESQDRLALAIIEREGALGDVLAGDFDTAIKKLGNRWASLPSSPYSQPKRDQAFVDRFVSARQPQTPARSRLEEGADTFLSTNRGATEQAARDHEGMIDRGRSMGEAASDIGLAVAGGFGGLGELVGTGVGLATGDMNNALRTGGAELRKWAQENQSKVMQAQKALRQVAIENSEDEAGKFFAYLSETLGSPTLAIDFIAEQAPQLLLMGGTGRVVGGAAKLAGLGEAAAGTAGTAAAIGTGSSMQGLDAAGQAYDQIKALPRELQLQNPTVQKLVAQGIPEDEAIDRAARAEAMIAGAASGGASAALNLLPGASTLERALAGGVKRGGSRAMGAVKGALGEGFTEGADEAGGVLTANYATQQFDPSQPLTAGVGEAAAAGALFAPFGGVAGAVQAGQPTDVPAPIPAVPSAPPDSPLQSAVAAAAAATPAATPASTPAIAPVAAPAADPAARLAELQAITQGTPDAPGRVLTQQEADEYRALTSQQQGIVSPEWSPASDPTGLAGPDPLAPRLAPIAAVLEDRAALSALRTDPRFGKAVVTDLLTAYARAKNPTLDRLTRDRSLSDLERLLGTFSQQPTYVPGASDLTPTTQQMLAEQEGGEPTATPEGAQAEQARRAAEALARRRAEAMANQRRAAAEYSTAFEDANDEIAQSTGVEQQDDILELNRLIAEEQADLAERRGNAAEAARIRNEARAARARNQVGKPAGSFGQMDEFAALFNAERADLEARRAQVAQDQQRGRETAQQRFEAELAAADARVTEARARESQARRQALLTDLIDAGVPAVNPVAGLATRFTTALQQAGYRDIVPTEDEMRVIQRAVDVANARGGIEPAAPNEMPADLVPARTQAGAPVPSTGKIAEVLRLLAQGWKLQGKRLVSKTGKVRILNRAELDAVKAALQAQREWRPIAVPDTQAGGMTNDVPTTQQVAPQAQEAGGQEGAATGEGTGIGAVAEQPTQAPTAPEQSRPAPGQRSEPAQPNTANPAPALASADVTLTDEGKTPVIATPLDAAAHEAATSPLNNLPQPTEEQKKAGNYVKGSVRLHGMDISIENPQGSVRSGTAPDGTQWENRIAHHYGYIKGSIGADQDQIDVFLTGDAETATVAWVIDQKNPDGSFDEHKAVIGPKTEDEARAAYLANYDEGWDGIGAITSMPMEAFRAWALDGKRKRKALAYVEPDIPADTKPAEAAPQQDVMTDTPTPIGNANEATIGGVQFSAERIDRPRPHWRAKIVESGEVIQSFSAGTRSELWDKLGRDFSAYGADRWRKALSLPDAPAEAADQPAQQAPFDPVAWDKARADIINASRDAGNVHLDQVPRYVETMRGKPIFYVHDPKVRGTIRTVDNRGSVYVDWNDAYSAERELASPTREGKKTVYRSSISISDLKDYALAPDRSEAVAEAAPQQEQVADTATAPQPLTSTPFATFEQLKTALKIVGDVPAIQDRLRGLNIANIPGKGWVNVPSKLRWDEVRANIPVRIDTYRLEGVPARLAEVTLEVMESGSVRLNSRAETSSYPDAETALRQYVERYKGAQEAAAPMPGEATHQDPGQPVELVTQPVIAQAIQKSARNTAFDPVEAKAWILGEIDKAIAAIPERNAELAAEMAREKAKTFDMAAAEKKYGKGSKAAVSARDSFDALRDSNVAKIAGQIGFITFDVPGDGKFKVVNTAEKLREFRAKVEKSPGFAKNPDRPFRFGGQGLAGAQTLDQQVADAKKFGGDPLADIGNAIEIARLKDGKDEDRLLDRFKEASGGKGYDTWRAEQEAAEEIAAREAEAREQANQGDPQAFAEMMAMYDAPAEQAQTSRPAPIGADSLVDAIDGEPFVPTQGQKDAVARFENSKQGTVAGLFLMDGDLYLIAERNGKQKVARLPKEGKFIPAPDGLLGFGFRDRRRSLIQKSEYDAKREADERRAEEGRKAAEEAAKPKVYEMVGVSNAGLRYVKQGGNWHRVIDGKLHKLGRRRGDDSLLNVLESQDHLGQLIFVGNFGEQPDPAFDAAEERAMEADLDRVPGNVQSRLSIALAALRETRDRLAGVMRARGKGQILALEVRDVQEEIARHRAILDEFRSLAPNNDVDAEAVIRALGGDPDFAEFGEPAAAEAPTEAPTAEPAQLVESPVDTSAIDLPPGKFSNETVVVKKKGRKWLEVTRPGKNFVMKMEINEVSAGFEVGQTYTVPANVETASDRYGTTVTIHPLNEAQTKAASDKAREPEILRWLGYVEEKAPTGYLYQKGVDTLKTLGIAKFPALKARLDAAIKQADDVSAKNEEKRAAEYAAADKARREQREKEAREKAVKRRSRMLYPMRNAPRLDVPKRIGGQAVVFTGHGERFKINEDHPSVHGSHLLGHEGDWGAYFYYRPATEEEVAALGRIEEASRIEREQKAALGAAQKALENHIRTRGEFPSGPVQPEGTVKMDTSTAYGGGSWFVVGSDWIWFVRNNGMDGDNWGSNNVTTGGAGAMGWRIPYSAEVDRLISDIARGDVLQDGQVEAAIAASVRKIEQDAAQTKAAKQAEVQPAYRLTFDQWLEQQWAGNSYRDAYLRNAGGDEQKAMYAAASGGGESEVSARNAYWSALMNAPRDADVSLEMYDSLTDAQKRDASRHFFRLDDLVRDRYQREAMQKKAEEDRVAREVIAPMQAEVDRLRSMNERTKSGTDAWNKRATDAASLEGLIADLRAERITVQELPAKWRGEGDQAAAGEAGKIAAEETGDPLFSQHKTTIRALKRGAITPEAFKASFEWLIANEEAIKAELSRKSDGALLRDGGLEMASAKYARLDRRVLVDDVYRSMVEEYALDVQVRRDSQIKDAVRRLVEETDAAKLAGFAGVKAPDVALPGTQVNTEATIPADQQQGGAQTPTEGVIPSQIGERLVGGRKDRAALQAMTADLTDEQIASMPLSKIWPADEIDKIEDVFVAAFSHAARAEIPAKPRSTYKIPLWVKKVKMFRQIVSDLLFRVDRAQMMQKLREAGGSLEGFASKVALLEAIDRKQWGRIGKVGEYPDATRYDENGNSQPAPFVNVEIDGSNVLFGNAGSVADVVERVTARLSGEVGDKKMAFEVRGSNGRYFINKKGDKEYRSLKTFTSAKEALAYRDSNYDDLVAAWEAVKDRDNVRKSDVRRDENRDRAGKDWRNGRDATGDDFLSTFGFRGVEFGDWVNQGEGARERQGMLNQAYDALMDLADVLGIPPKAVSLNGSMGLAFGSRGSGTASAHFEPGNLVINLTKTRGAGKLAHEWFHALDNYFARQRGGEVSMQGGEDAQMVYRRNNYITYRPETYYVKGSTTIPAKDFEAAVAAGPVRTLSGSPDKERRALYLTWRMIGDSTDGWVKRDGVRPEVEGRFAELVEALEASPMTQRSARNDKSATDGYWSRIIERGARAFENYVILKMRQQGYQNDYLANVRTPEEFPRSADRYPYLLDDESAPIEEAFDNLFGTIQTRETEQGVAMFSFAAPAAPQSLAEVESSWDSQGIENALSEKDGIITLHKIIVPDGKREAGVGTKAMQELFAYADATGQQVALTPSGDFGGNKRRLESFYRGLGFRTYKGFAVREKLIRDPASPEVRYSFAGERAATADKMALGAAQARLAAGEDAETVRQETGWFRGADGKWRFEVSDADAKLKKPYPSKGQRWGDVWRLQSKGDQAITVGAMIDHPALFAAYPQIADIPVSAKPGNGASYSPQSRRIYLGEDVQMHKALSELLHEIQHGIQTVEGFATGGSANAMTATVTDSLKIADAYGAFAEELEKLGVDTRNMPDLDMLLIDPDQTIEDYLFEIPRNVDDTNEVEWAADELRQVIDDNTLSPQAAYRRLAGEVEARNTQARQRMTDAERRATPPSQTADVADADVIVVFNGKEMESAPVPANALRTDDSPATSAAVSRPAANTLIADFLATRPGAPGITLVDRFADLPAQVQQDALAQGGNPVTTKGAVFDGRVYLVRENHGSITDLEATLYHETVGHVGLRTMLGDDFTQKLNQLYLALGGQTGLVSIMTRRGMGQKAQQYVRGIRQAVEADAAKKANDPAYRRRWTEAVANGVLTEEVFAHIAQQQGARPGLMDRFKALIGAVRDWLRRHKLMNLASLGETDLLYMLDKARRGLNGPGGPRGGRVPATARIDGKMMPPTIMVDGVERPTTNSKGQSIYPTEEGVRNFWRWFGEEGLLDGDGQPIVVYHGGEADFAEMKTGGRFGQALFVREGGPSGYGKATYPLYLRGDVVAHYGIRRRLDADEWRELLTKVTREELDDDDVDSLLNAIASDAVYPDNERVLEVLGATDEADAQAEMQRLLAKVASELGASAIRIPDEFDGETLIVVDPLAIKSATGNNGDFNPQSPVTVFSIDEAASMPREDRQAYLAEAAGRGPGVIRQGITDIIAAFRSPSAKVFGPLHKSISTSLHKASISPQFAEVFQIADRYERDISRFSAEPAAKAPKLIPSFDKLSDTVNRIIHGDKVGRMAPQVADAIFAGTLAGDSPTNGRVWTDAELRGRFGMDDELIGLYREARDALDLSLDISGAGIAWQMVKRYIPAFKEAVRTAPVDAARTIELAMLELEAQTRDAASRVMQRMQADEAAADALRPEHARLILAADDIGKARAAAQEVAKKVAALKAGGYAPLMRFGKYNIDVTQQNEDGTEERIAFFKFETEIEAKTAEQRLRRQYPDATIARSVSSEEAWKVFQGVDPDTVALFAEHIGELEGLGVKDEVLQAWYRDAVNNRSAFKRMIHRKGTEGFDRDLTRVLASFVTSNARMAARQFNLPDMSQRIAELKRTKAPGDVVDEAERLRSYIENPEEPFKGLKGWMFAWFLGGSLSSALLNATQPFMMTLPYLSQFGAARAAAELAKAMKGGATGKVTDPELQAALLRAAEDGKVDAQQVHHLFHEGMRPLISKLPFGQNARARAQGVMTAWGWMFGAVENMNRRMSFIAAYNMAKADPKLGDAYEFAIRAVDETQGIYTKSNRPNFARGVGPFGAVGVAAFTFKQYSIGYVEMMIRMAKAGPAGKRAALMQLGILVMLAGLQGIPGAEDLEDLIDTAAQYMGYTGNSRLELHRYLKRVVGEEVGNIINVGADEIANIIQHGLLSASVLRGDLSSRIGMGDLFPATAIAKPSTQSRAAELADIFGPPATMSESLMNALLAFDSGAGAMGVTKALLPVALSNAWKGANMAIDGRYVDARGRKVVETDMLDAGLKFFGIQPSVVNAEQRPARLIQLSAQRLRQVKGNIHALRAQAIVEQNPEKRRQADEMLRNWNENNPGARLSVSAPAILRRVKEMNAERRARLMKSLPKEMRQSAAEEFEQ